MKLIAFTCPSCGARLDVDVENKTATCQFCGANFPIEEEVQHFQMDGAAQAGYEFEKGRQRAQAEAATQQVYNIPTSVQEEAPQKKRRTWLWVLGWIIIFPVPLTLIMLKKKDMNPKLRYGIIAAGWLVYFAIGLSGSGGKSKNKTEDTSSESVAAQEAGTDSTETEAKETVDEEASDTKSDENNATDDAILLEANIPGEFGKTFTIYGGGSEDDMGTRLGWFVPKGTYTVKNLDESGPWEQVNYGNPEPIVNDDGFKESAHFENVLIKPGEEADVVVPEGGCIYITGDSGQLELKKQ